MMVDNKQQRWIVNLRLIRGNCDPDNASSCSESMDEFRGRVGLDRK